MPDTDPDLEILDKLAHVIAKQFRTDASKISAATTAFDVSGWDSMSHTLLLMRIEKEFGIRIGWREAGAAKNVGELATLVGASPKRER